MAMHFKKQEKTEAERKKSTERRGFYLALARVSDGHRHCGVEHIRYRFRVLGAHREREQCVFRCIHTAPHA